MGYKLKGIYVGADKVRPSEPAPILQLSTDLKQCSSLADVTAQGWTGIAKYNSGNYTLANGNGIELTSGHNLICSLYYQLATPLTTSNRVIMHCTGNGKNGSYAGAVNMLLSTATGDAGGTGSRLSFYATETGIRIDSDSSDLNHGNGYGDFDITQTIDLSTGEITYTGTAASGSYTTINLTRTMDATQIQNAISRSYITFELMCYSFYAHKLYSAEVTIY